MPVVARCAAAFVRRLLAVATMLGGAVLGAELVLNVNPATALAVATGLLAIITTAAWQTTRKPAPPYARVGLCWSPFLTLAGYRHGALAASGFIWMSPATCSGPM